MLKKFTVTIKCDVFIYERFKVLTMQPDVVDGFTSQLQVVPTDGFTVTVQLISQRPEQTISGKSKNKTD